MNTRPFAIVTGASSGIGLELAREAASRGYDLLANVVPDVLLAQQHRKMAEPGSARN